MTTRSVLAIHLIIILILYLLLPSEGNRGCSPYDVPLTASLPDSNFNASSVLSGSLNQPYMAKINGSKEWCPFSANPDSEFIQVDLSTPFRVCAVDTQGHHTLSSWFVSSYKVTYSLNGSTWFIAQENETNYVSKLPAIDTSFPRNKTVLEGHQFTLLCFPLGNLDNVTWIKKSISNSSSPVSAVNLTMNATRDDIGEYYCLVTNGVESIASPTAYVNVLYPPALDASYPRDHTVAEDANLTLHVE
ncbi:phosphatidylethanolamine binding [Desmophyllum pertusum]|uniref:Phosphatidylethanolamine binding n=1 Tax=Desmophyllum pertusum TaxID=174260 RepID=A0A9W9ZKT7_9CNID|nr:phosphatidylethanolamine binding [Desmophyllum pertusum]